ncbi:MAG: glycosyltransferase family 2 protein, partial [Erysipelotrichaceae bacterium]|nr:glycosyltransferase family 2 protein [Erysipelotrichaceae bacterium]MDD4642656.1 glycosyltransferase family 2 protein [Erysipelotrichaceae bacterium]
MNHPLISIVLPIYNVEDYLERCLLSIKDQTLNDFEVLCINDGSTDDSQMIIDKYVAIDSRFKSYQKTNGGLSDA